MQVAIDGALMTSSPLAGAVTPTVLIWNDVADVRLSWSVTPE